MVLKITSKNFEKEVMNSEKPVLVDCFTEWCMPCKMMKNIVEEVSNEDSEIKFCGVDLDQNPEIATKYNISGVPTFLFIKNGEIKDIKVGAFGKNVLLDKISKLKT